jgi:hypothetical protein
MGNRIPLQELPAFAVEKITLSSHTVELRGRFNHLTGVQLGTSHLYCGDCQWPGELIECDAATHDAVFTAPSWVQLDRIHVRSVVPWLPSRWQFFHVNMILARDWERRAFVPSDAQHFRVGDLHGWTKFGTPLADNHTLTHVEKDGWDHEECRICDAHIGRGGSTEGYVNQSDWWLCQNCYERYGRDADLGFILDR